MMNDVVLTVAEQDRKTIRLIARGPWGQVEIVCDVRLEEGTIYATGLHIDGPGSGTLGRIGIDMICRRVLEDTDASQIVVEGSTRTSGANRGRRPRTFRFSNRKRSS
jgi:hypothetical protein